MISKLGLNGLVKSSLPSKTTQVNAGSGGRFIIGRVLDIILNEEHPLFNEYGQYNSIGIIEIELIVGGNNGTRKIVKPLFPHIKSYPLVNELVTCFPLPIPTLDNTRLNTQYYYLNSINTWNHPHHNALPTPTNNNIISQNQTQDYQQSEGGTVRRVTDNSTEINLGSPTNTTQNTFIERSNIHPLIPFEGDIIYEGRFGNSLRFGSTSKTNTSINNSWSSEGENGNPIIVLRNGQPNNSTSEGWIPITENIRNDLSSIYLTSTQKLQDFKVSSEIYDSYTKPPTPPNSFTKPQIALNSDRIVINAKTDSILLSSQKSIGLSTNESINLDTKEVSISSPKIKLGSKNATEPVLKGDTTVELLKQLTKAIKDLSSILEVDKNWPGGNLQTGYNPVAGNVSIVLNDILSQLYDNSLKSQTTLVQ